MAVIDELNMIQLLKSGLGKEVKLAVTEELVKEELVSYEKKLRATIKPIVERVTFDGVDSIKDCMRMRNELHVFLHWKDED